MTIVDYEDSTEIPDVKTGLFAVLHQVLAASKRRQAERQTITALSRLDAHLLRDIGIDPRDVQDAFSGRHSSLLFEPMRPHDHE